MLRFTQKRIVGSFLTAKNLTDEEKVMFARIQKKELYKDQNVTHVQVEYFDQLRDKYHQVKEKVAVYSRKCSHLEERLRTLNTKPVIKPKLVEARPYKPKKVVGKENSLGVYEDLVDDPTIPKGWSSAVKTMSEAFGDDVKAVV